MTEEPKNNWKNPDIPKHAWKNESIFDLEHDRVICEMCNTTEIRYVHVMKHEKYSKTLEVGCICAGKLEGDEKKAREREKDHINWLKRKQNRASKLRNEENWRVSKQGNSYLKIDGCMFHLQKCRNGAIKGDLFETFNKDLEPIGKPIFDMSKERVVEALFKRFCDHVHF